MMERLDLENIEKDISELFEGLDGLYTLYRYIWSPDLFQTVLRIKTLFESKSAK